MNRALSLLNLIECGCDEEKKHTCPKCGHSFGEDNTEHVLKDAEVAEFPYVPDDKNTSGQVSDEMGIRRRLGNDLFPFKVQK